MKTLRTSLLFALSLFLPAISAAEGTVHVVDDDGGPGVHFVDLRNAVDAATDGDLILIREGYYYGTLIDGKSLTLAAETGAYVQLTGGLWVRNLDAGDTVVAQGLLFYSPFAFIAEHNEGEIVLDDCRLWGLTTLPAAPSLGARLTNCASVTFSGCSISASNKAAGCHGIQAINSNVNLYASSVQGGAGGASASSVSVLPRAGSGVYLSGGELLAVGSVLAGGDGSHGWHQGPVCTSGGDGGHGLLTEPNASVASDVRLLDTQLIAGGAGKQSIGHCSAGLPGQSMSIATAPVVHMAGNASDLTVVSPVRAGQTTQFDFTAMAGDRAATVEAPTMRTKYYAALSGMLVPARMGAVRKYAGTLSSSSLQLVRNTSLATGAEFDLTFVQSLITTPGSSPVLGPPHALIVLDPSF
jgi:hypothetical protein